MIKVLIADDHAFIRQSLQDLFAETRDIQVVASVEDGTDVVEAVLRTEPDVVLMDIAMPRLSGLAATRELLAARPHTRVVMLTGSVSRSSVCEATGLGVMGYLVKGDDPADLPDRIREVVAGTPVWSAEVAVHISSCS